jgi:ABC-2 type transport system ATP-binding protein
MIEARQLTKTFGQKLAVDGISFKVEQGEVLGFLGPNAAGKSTTMRMITGFLPPTSGTAMVGGSDVIKDSLAARKKIGYLPENAPVYPDMPVIEFLGFVAEIRGFTGREKAQRIGETMERCFLGDVRYQTINTLSKGFKQRVCFAQSILHDPEYLIMDEPTDGLDPNQKHEVRAMIREMARRKTIILSTHNLEEVEAVCTRAIIINRGKIAADDTPDGLKTRSAYRGAVCFRVRKPEAGDLLNDIKAIAGVGEVEVVSEGKADVTLRAYPKEAGSSPAQQILQHLQANGHAPETLYVEDGRLDEVFRMITTANRTEEAR